MFLLQIVQNNTDSLADTVKHIASAATQPINPVTSIQDFSLWELIVKGGPVMIPIALCSLIAVYIIVERFVAIRKASRLPINFMNNIRDSIHNGNVESAKILCKSTESPIARMIEKGTSRLGKPLGDIEKAIENVGNIEVAKLESGLAALATCAGAAPMLGFLGTVTGMVRAFHDMKVEYDRTHANIDIGVLASGMYEAMVTTVAGLIVGITALICYNILASMVKKVVFKMETTSIDFIDLLQEPEK
ncbi:MAG: MotA/TolQ/ExbB proton channel family protein [Bacteroidota bacterium]